ncbi:MAG: GNAT family N-acetyltransferase [Pseudomonadota bacterium]
MIPTLTTDRLTLRAPRLEDFDAYAAFYADPDATRFIGGPRDTRAAWRSFAADTGHWHLKGFGWWIVAAAGRVLGSIGLHHPPSQPDLELGWLLFPAAQGQGYATEAASAARAWGRAELRPARLVSYIDAGNAASIRLAERLGAVREAARAAHDPDCFVYRHPGAP